MRRFLTAVLALFWVVSVFGQEIPAESTTVSAQAEPNTVVDYRVSQWGAQEKYSILDTSWVVRRRWEPRVVFWEFFSPQTERQEKKVAIGVGYRVLNHEHIVVVQDFLISRAWSRAGERVTFFQPTTRAFITLGHRWSMDLAGFPYIPIAGHGHLEWVAERVRMAYKVNRFVTLAGGWGATELPGTWQHGANFGVTFTPKHGRFGSWEVAYQNGLQLHVIASGRPHLRHRKVQKK
jgi:hypothetical protein